MHRKSSASGEINNDKNNPLLKKHILLLQGPVGPFFKILANEFESSGAKVSHVCFNAADEFFSNSRHRVCYTKSDKEWFGWLESVHDLAPFDLIVLFGCERSRHVTAIEFGEKHSIPVLCLEEGYVRPGFITAELSGNNRRSPLKDIDIDVINLNGVTMPTAASGSSFNAMAWYGFVYYVIRQTGILLGRTAGNHHKDRKLVPEAYYWLRNVYRKQTRHWHNERVLETLFNEQRRNYVVVPMQVRDDGQLLAAGRGWNNEKVIESLIPSFAKHAPSELLLVFKAHPLERGHTDAKSKISRLAALHGVSKRVVYIDDGSMGQVTKYAKAMMTINSTSALSALHFNIPIAVLGDAMFRRDDLATCINEISEIDSFWSSIPESNPIKNEKFMSALRSMSLLAGDFYSFKNMPLAAKEIANKSKALLTKL